MFLRLKKIKKLEGRWAIFTLFSLALNRLRVVFLRFLLGVDDIYFQGSPKIIGRRFISFGKSFVAGRNVWIEAVCVGNEEIGSPIKINIGNNVSLSEFVHIAALKSVSIGHDVLIGSCVLITDHDHGAYDNSIPISPDDLPNRRPLSCRGPVVIEDNVWLGDGVRILSGSHVERGAIIAANTVVKGRVPAGSIYASAAGNKVIKIYDYASGSWRKL